MGHGWLTGRDDHVSPNRWLGGQRPHAPQVERLASRGSAPEASPMKKRPAKAPKTGSSKKIAAPLRPSSALALARDVGPLVERVVAILDEARSRVVRTVNSTMVLAYWHVGREIVEFVQRGAKRAEYGEQVREELSAHLRARIGRATPPRTSGTSEPSTWRSRPASLRFATSKVANLGAKPRARPSTFATSEVAFRARSQACPASKASRPCSGGPITER